MRRREEAGKFRAWLQEHAGYCLASWAHHLTGVSKSAITLAMRQGRVRFARYTFPDGHSITLIFLFDALRLDVYSNRRGWADDLDNDDPRSRPKAYRRGPRGSGGGKGGQGDGTRQAGSNAKNGQGSRRAREP